MRQTARVGSTATEAALEKFLKEEFISVKYVPVKNHVDGLAAVEKVSLECQGGLPSVRGDRVQLQQVVLNLLINAFDAMRDGTAQEHNVKVRATANGAGTVEISAEIMAPV